MSVRITRLDALPDGILPEGAKFMGDHLGAEKAYRVSPAELLLGMMKLPMPTGVFAPGTFGARVANAGSGAGEPLGITSFEHNHSDIILAGSTIANVELTWDYNFFQSDIVSITISGPGDPGVMDNADLSHTIVGINATDTSTWTIGIQTSIALYTATATLQFGFYVYHGRGAAADLDEAGIEALSENEILADRNGQKVFTANGDGAAGAYLWFAWPTSYGGVPVMVDHDTGLVIPLLDRGTVSVTNNGVTTDYRLVRSEFDCNGAVALDVVL